MPSPKVVVVGAGVFGACAAYLLARAGATVTLVERDEPGRHASARNPGNLNPILGNKRELVPMALESAQLHRALAADLHAAGLRYAIDPVRRVLVAFDDADCADLDETEKLFAGSVGFATTRLQPAALRSIEARLSVEVVQGLRIDGNESVDSAAFNRALIDGAQRAGAQIIRSEVLGLERRDRRVSSLRTRDGALACDFAVFATGPWVVEVGAWLGLELSVEPVKGEMLRMRLPRTNVTHDFTHGLISLYRRGADEVWVGVTRERCGFDETPTAAARHALIDGAARILPAIREATVLEQLASLRPMTPNGLPVLGKVPGWDNALVANGGGIKGVLLSAGIATAIRDLVMTGRTALPVQEFAL